MRKIEYSSPKENSERGETPQHTVDMINEKGELMGRAEIDYFSKPIPYFQITDIYTEVEFQGRGVASEIMEWIENWLQMKKKAGFLVDAILPGNPAKGFYERRGWIAVPANRDQFVFNLPKNTSPSIFVSVEMRQKPLMEREGFKKKNIANGLG